LKKSAGGIALFFLVAVSGFSQYYFDYPAYKKFDLGIELGMMRPSFMGATTYGDAWAWEMLSYVSEETLISGERTWVVNPEVFATWNFSPSMGIRLSVGGFSAEVPNRSDIGMTWGWADYPQIHKSASWTGTGRIVSLPLGLNIVIKSKSPVNTWHAVAGLTYSWNSFSAESSFGFGKSDFSEDGTVQYIDVLKIPLRIPKTSWSSLGGNIGLGTTFALSDSLGLGLEADYYFFEKKTFSWSFVYGQYDGVFYGVLKNRRFAPVDVEIAGTWMKMSKFDVNLSRWRVALFLVLSLGTIQEK
jgi:hypothetical protein